MTDWYVKGYKVTLFSTRSGDKMVVVRVKGSNKYVTHFKDSGRLDDWLSWMQKEINNVEVKPEEEI